jgi:DNA-binding response OmpR family regulator
VDVVGTAREALARATDVRYDGVMLDLRLPDRPGDEILEDLRHLPTAPSRVVFITGDTQSETARRALAATGCSIVSKPFLLDELASIMLAEADG